MTNTVKPPEKSPPKPSILRSLRFGAAAYISVLSRNFWESTLEYINASLYHHKRNKSVLLQDQPPKNMKERVRKEADQVIDDTKRNFSVQKLADPLAIMGAVGATYAHYKNSRNTYRSWQERKEIVDEQRKSSLERQMEQRQTAADRKEIIKKEMQEEIAAQVLAALKKQGIVPDTPLHSAPTPEEASLTVPEQQTASGIFTDRNPPRAQREAHPQALSAVNL